MKKCLMVFAVLVGSLFVLNNAVLAGCGSCCGPSACALPKAEGVSNSVCPVMGGKVVKDTPYTAQYKGTTIGFCCAACISTFNKNPEKYAANLASKGAAAADGVE